MALISGLFVSGNVLVCCYKRTCRTNVSIYKLHWAAKNEPYTQSSEISLHTLSMHNIIGKFVLRLTCGQLNSITALSIVRRSIGYALCPHSPLNRTAFCGLLGASDIDADVIARRLQRVLVTTAQGNY